MHNQKRRGVTIADDAPPLPPLIWLLCSPLSFRPALIESQYVRPDAAGNGFYLMLGDIGVIYKFLSPAQIIPPFTDL